MRDKRALMKFLKYVLQEPTESMELFVESSGTESLAHVLSSQFKISSTLQQPLLALSLSHDTASSTNGQQAVRRIRKHLRSIGMFGPGFGAMIPKYGGGAEIAQVGCRAGAVGGGVYVLGRGIYSLKIHAGPGEHVQTSDPDEQEISVKLSDGEIISTKYVVGGVEDLPHESTTRPSTNPTNDPTQSARSISVISSTLSHLFPPTSEHGPIPAGAVVVISGNEEMNEGRLDTEDSLESPIYLLVHSSESGECPTGQCVVYGSTAATDEHSRARLDEAVNKLVSTSNEDRTPSILWSMSYTLRGTSISHRTSMYHAQDASGHIMSFPPASLDLAFDDDLIDGVEAVWKKIVASESDEVKFMQFEEREAVEEDDNDDGYQV